MAKLNSLVLLVINFLSLISLSAGQELKTVVKGHLDTAVKATKEQLGISVNVQGQNGYDLVNASAGTNLTFVLSGRDLEENIDPFVKIAFTSNDGSFGTIGSTESGTESSQPDWTQPFWFVWKKGTEQNLTFRIFDHKTQDRLIAEPTLDVDKYVEQGQNSTLDFGNGRILVEKTTPVKFKLSAKNIRRADEFNGKSDAYVKVYFRTGMVGKDKKFYTTTTIDNVENADWGDVVEFTNYQKGKDQYLHFKLRDADSFTKDDHLGEVLVEADAIFDKRFPQTMYLENSGKHSTLTVLPM